MPINNAPQRDNVSNRNQDGMNGVGDEAGTATPHLSDKGNPALAGGMAAQEQTQSGIGNIQDVPDGDRRREQGGSSQGDERGANEDANPGSMQTATTSDEADRLRGTPDDRPAAARQESSDDIGTAQPSAH